MLYQLDLLDTAPQPIFDDFTIVCSRLLDVPVALVSLVDERGGRQFFVSQVGLPEPFASARQTPLDRSFCKHVTRARQPLRVVDARTDARVQGNLAITDLSVIAYLGQPILAPDGTIIGALCAIDSKPRDWTEQEEDTLLRLSRMVTTQIALRHTVATQEEDRRHLADLLNTIPLGVTSVNAEGAVIYANPAACRILGLRESAVGTRRFDDPNWKIAALDGGPFPVSELPVARILAGEERVEQVVHAIEWPDGQRRILSIDAARSHRSCDGTAVICAITDSTDRHAADARLQDAVDQAQAASRAKTAFLANMSHEIRTPLTGILGLSELMQEQAPDADTASLAQSIRSSGEALLNVVNAVLDLSQIEAGKLSLHPEPFDIVELLNSQHRLHGICALRKGLDFPPPAIDATLERMRLGDDFRLGQIIGNLLGNAVKFTGAGGISLTLTRGVEDELVFGVTDTGIGMTADQIARVTTEFEQADSSISRIYGGSGLGLAIVKRLVGLMGGDMAIRSTVGSGTEIRVRLPLPAVQRPAVVPTGPDAPSAGAPETTSIAGLRLLVAEDNATNALILKRMLAELGVAATFARDGVEACNAWQPGGFDVLLFDISMPVLDGVTALSLIHECEARQGLVPSHAIAATANVLKAQEDAYLAAGFSGLLRKPFGKASLEKVLVEAVTARVAKAS